MLGVAILAAFATLIPTLSPETPGMKSIGGAYVTVYYEREEAAAQDVFTLMNAQSEHIAEMLVFDSPQDIKVYVYDDQSTFQTKKYGLVALLLNMDWYIGDNRGTNVLLTSPANPGSAHTYDSVKNSGPHEMVHAYNSLLNKDMSPIDWNKSPREISCQVRGLIPWPVATMELGGKPCKVFSVRPVGKTTDKAPGTPVAVTKKGLEMACGGGSVLLVEEVQAQGGKRMRCADYLRGHPITIED